MKTASLGLLEVKWYVRIRGKLTRLSLCFAGAEDSSLLYFWREESFGFTIFSWTDVEALFLANRRYTLSCGRT